jgi:hypothetical protein
MPSNRFSAPFGHGRPRYWIQGPSFMTTYASKSTAVGRAAPQGFSLTIKNRAAAK